MAAEVEVGTAEETAVEALADTVMEVAVVEVAAAAHTGDRSQGVSIRSGIAKVSSLILVACRRRLVDESTKEFGDGAIVAADREQSCAAEYASACGENAARHPKRDIGRWRLRFICAPRSTLCARTLAALAAAVNVERLCHLNVDAVLLVI